MQHAAGIGEVAQRHRRADPREVRAGLGEALHLAVGHRRSRVVGAGEVRVHALTMSHQREAAAASMKPAQE
jgi:hypothetical protein